MSAKQSSIDPRIPRGSYWSYKQLHEVTGMPMGTLYGLVSSGRIPHVRLGPRHVIFEAQAVLKWIEKHRVLLGVEA